MARSGVWWGPDFQQEGWTEEKQKQADLDVAPIDAQIKNLSLKWHPTGLYQPADMNKMFTMVTATVKRAIEAIQKAPLTTEDAVTGNKQSLSALSSRMQEGMKFINASIVAAGKQTLVDAPDFKKWVIRTLQDTSQAFGHASILASNRSWIKDAIRTFMPFLVPACEFLMKVGGAVKDAAKKALDFSLDKLKPVLYVGLGLVGVFAVTSVARAFKS